MKSSKRLDLKTKFKKGDEVIVLTGRSKGTTGKIENIQADGKVIVTGANVFKKHQKANMQNPDGGITTRPMPLDISNVAFVDPKTKKATRLGFKVEGDSKKVRIAKASGNLV